MSNEKFYKNINLCSVVTFAIILRWSVSLHSYSGQNTPPLYGDYEAQRHWMEITVNLPLKEWYVNTSRNDLLYWGLDYPPLTGYHSFLLGKIAQCVDPKFIELYSSRGYESYEHKFFMRATVIIADIIIYFVSLILFYNYVCKPNQNNMTLMSGETTNFIKQKTNCTKSLNSSLNYITQVSMALLYPGLILIDHGHFQYNCISLGLTVYAVTALVCNRFLLSSFLFCLALNYKQMSLYHSLTFFTYMLSHCFQCSKSNGIILGLKKFSWISATVIFTFSIIWFPFIREKNISHVVKRLFPFSRGVFEDKVANFWCTINVLYKVNKILNQSDMVKICVICVLSTSLFSLVNLFRIPTIKSFLLSMINVSLSFFLFSYQVHEKSILLVALPVLLFFPFDPFPCFWILIISNFSMLPLYYKDKLIIPFVSLTVLFTLFVFANVSFFPNNIEKKLNKGEDNFFCKKNIKFMYYLFKTSMIGCLVIFFGLIFIKPPERYPDLWPLLCSVYSCLHFCLFSLYFNFIQVFKM